MKRCTIQLFENIKKEITFLYVQWAPKWRFCTYCGRERVNMKWQYNYPNAAVMLGFYIQIFDTNVLLPKPDIFQIQNRQTYPNF